MSATIRLTGAVLVLHVLAGCGGATQPPTHPPEQQTDQPGAQLPARPMTLELAGVNPCLLLADVQIQKFGVRPGSLQHSSDSAPVHSASYCDWQSRSARPDYGYTGGLADNVGAEYTLGLEPLRSVQGFAATTGKALGTDPRWYCGMLVDVAPAKALQVTFENPTRDIPGMSHEVACDRAQALADAMLTTFQSMPR